jgi:hypothetical protein
MLVFVWLFTSSFRGAKKGYSIGALKNRKSK